MSKTVLFISELPDNISNEELEEFFSAYKEHIFMIQIDRNQKTYDIFNTRKPRATIIFKNHEKEKEEELEGVDPNLNLQENISNDNNEILVSKDAKKQLSLSLLAILLRSKNISNSDKVKYKNLIQKIQNSDYYYTYSNYYY